MSSPIIQIRNISKLYRLGQLGAGSLREDFANWWTRARRRSAVQCPENELTAPQSQDFWALKDVSFEVRQGEVLGIIGRNGAGKSTLLKILARITQPTSGEAILRGRVASLLEVGTGFHPELSGRDNVFLNGAILGMKRAEIRSRFEEIVEFSEVGQFIDTPVKRYSSGMYVRLAFAVAAHLEPEILIVDEVLAVGDAAFQQKCLGKMKDVSQKDGRTVLFVSHNVHAVRRLCQAALLLESGRSQGALSVEDAIKAYVAKVEISANQVSLLNLPRPVGRASAARLTKLALVGRTALAYGEAGEIEVGFEVLAQVEPLMVGIGFATLDGHRVLSMDSDALAPPKQLTKGAYLCRFSIDYWPLSPAQYVISVALASGHNYHDMVEPAAVWEIIAGSEDHVSARGFGGCRIAHRAEFSISDNVDLS
jgi:lipopolysaccharide transport system ATP-binding protein